MNYLDSIHQQKNSSINVSNHHENLQKQLQFLIKIMEGQDNKKKDIIDQQIKQEFYQTINKISGIVDEMFKSIQQQLDQMTKEKQKFNEENNQLNQEYQQFYIKSLKELEEIVLTPQNVDSNIIVHKIREYKNKLFLRIQSCQNPKLNIKKEKINITTANFFKQNENLDIQVVNENESINRAFLISRDQSGQSSIQHNGQNKSILRNANFQNDIIDLLCKQIRHKKEQNISLSELESQLLNHQQGTDRSLNNVAQFNLKDVQLQDLLDVTQQTNRTDMDFNKDMIQNNLQNNNSIEKLINSFTSKQLSKKFNQKLKIKELQELSPIASNFQKSQSLSLHLQNIDNMSFLENDFQVNQNQFKMSGQSILNNIQQDIKNYNFDITCQEDEDQNKRFKEKDQILMASYQISQDQNQFNLGLNENIDQQKPQQDNLSYIFGDQNIEQNLDKLNQKSSSEIKNKMSIGEISTQAQMSKYSSDSNKGGELKNTFNSIVKEETKKIVDIKLIVGENIKNTFSSIVKEEKKVVDVMQQQPKTQPTERENIQIDIKKNEEEIIKINPSKITPKILKKYENGINLQPREEFPSFGIRANLPREEFPSFGIRAQRKSLINKSINNNFDVDSLNITKNNDSLNITKNNDSLNITKNNSPVQHQPKIYNKNISNLIQRPGSRISNIQHTLSDYVDTSINGSLHGIEPDLKLRNQTPLFTKKEIRKPQKIHISNNFSVDNGTPQNNVSKDNSFQQDYKPNQKKIFNLFNRNRSVSYQNQSMEQEAEQQEIQKFILTPNLLINNIKNDNYVVSQSVDFSLIKVGDSSAKENIIRDKNKKIKEKNNISKLKQPIAVFKTKTMDSDNCMTNDSNISIDHDTNQSKLQDDIQIQINNKPIYNNSRFKKITSFKK